MTKLRTKITLFLGLLGIVIAALGFTVGCGDDTTGEQIDPCFDYSNFKGDSPAVSFRNDVIPIFQQSCAISSTCHTQDATPTNQPFLSPPIKNTPTSLDYEAILDAILGEKDADDKRAGVTAQVPTSTGGTQSEPGGMLIVQPGKPDESFMMYKMDGSQSKLCAKKLECAKNDECGTSMPQGSAQLSADARDKVRRWIAQGAQDN